MSASASDQPGKVAVCGQLIDIVTRNGWETMGDELVKYGALMHAALMGAVTLHVGADGKVYTQRCDYLAELPLTTDAADAAGGTR